MHLIEMCTVYITFQSVLNSREEPVKKISKNEEYNYIIENIEQVIKIYQTSDISTNIGYLNESDPFRCECVLAYTRMGYKKAKYTSARSLALALRAFCSTQI